MSDIAPLHTRSCPVCQSPLIAAVRERVPIDRCPRCRGVWLDAGELDRILAHAWAARDDDDDDDDDRDEDEPSAAGAFGRRS